MIIAVTGHRPNKLNNEYDGIGPYSNYIRSEFNNFISIYNPKLAISGMALGVDILWAECVLARNIPLLAAIPCVGQENKWPDKSQKRYKSILENKLVTTHYVGNNYYNGCMQKRNEFMVDKCDLLIAVWDGSYGGTSNCINYAKSKNKTMVVIGIIHGKFTSSK